MKSRIVELYVGYDGTLDSSEVSTLVYTNAPDDIVKNVCEDIKNDGILNRSNGINGIIGVLVARGYECVILDNIPRYGFHENK